MNCTVKQCSLNELFLVKKYIKKFKGYKTINDDLLMYLRKGIIFIIINNDTRNCEGAIVSINHKIKHEDKYVDTCYIAFNKIDSIHIGKIQHISIYTMLSKFSLDNELVSFIPYKEYGRNDYYLTKGFNSNYYLDKTKFFYHPSARMMFNTLSENQIMHQEPKLNRFAHRYSEINEYHMQPSKVNVDRSRAMSQIHFETEYNLLYFNDIGDNYELVSAWSLANLKNKSAENIKIYSDIKRLLLSFDKVILFDRYDEFLYPYANAIDHINKIIISRKEKLCHQL